MADVNSNLDSWSTTAASNSPTGATSIGGGLDDNLREIQAVTRKYLATKGADIASGSTVDLSAATGNRIDVTHGAGTTAITALGTLTAGMWKIVRFVITGGTLTMTHNASSLKLPSAANITLATGDCGLFVSLGSGNWECAIFQRANGAAIYLDINGLTAETTVAQASDYVAVYDASVTGNRKMLVSDLVKFAATSFTPTARGTGVNGAGTYSVQTGKYIQIGNMVFFWIAIAWTAHTGTGTLRIADLPVAAGAGINYPVSVRCDNFTYGAGKQLVGYVAASASEITLEAQETATSSAEITLDTSVGTFTISGCYLV